MARTFEKYEPFEIKHGEDVWPLIERAEAVLLDQVITWGSGDFREVVDVEDTSGTEDFASVAEAKAGTHRPLVRVKVSFWERGGRRYGERYASAWAANLDSPRASGKRFWINASGPEEAPVVGIVNVTRDEVQAARRKPAVVPDSTGNIAPQPSRWRAVMNHPWVVGIGVTAIGTVLATLIILWLT